MTKYFVFTLISVLVMLFGIHDIKGQANVITPDPSRGQLYSITNKGGNYNVYLSKFDYQTGVATAISPGVVASKINAGVSALDPVHHRFIILTWNAIGPDTICNIDLATGLVVNKNIISQCSIYANDVIEYNCRDTTLYTMAHTRSNFKPYLTSINALTGVQTIISPGPVGTMAGSGQSALDPVNRRLFYIGFSDTLYSINLTTGAVVNKARLSSSGYNYHSQLEYNSEDQTLYSVMGGGNNSSWFTKIDPVTGLVTKITPGPGKLGGYVGTFQSALDPVNKLYFCMTNDSLSAINLTTGTYAYKNKEQYTTSVYGSRFLGYESPCTQVYTGIETHQDALLSTDLFPNPFSTSTTIKLKRECNNATLCVYNLAGEKVNELKNIYGQEIKLSRNNLPAAMYFICLTEEKSVIGFEKIIISD